MEESQLTIATDSAPITLTTLVRSNVKINGRALICQSITFVVGVVVTVVGMNIGEPRNSNNSTTADDSADSTKSLVVTIGAGLASQAIAFCIAVLIFMPVLVFGIVKHAPPSCRSSPHVKKIFGKLMPPDPPA